MKLQLTLLAVTLSAVLHAQTPSVQPSAVFFRQNKGQVADQYGRPRPDILVSGHAHGLTYHLDKQGLHYQLQQRSGQHTAVYRIDVRWLGAHTNPEVEYLNPLPGYENFYNVPQGTAPALMVRSYGEVRYKNVYPGIDVRFYEKDGQLEYDFELAPYADPKSIKLSYSGADMAIAEGEQLRLQTPLGEIREGNLAVWQGSHRVGARWKLHNQTASFELSAYDRSQPLRIDPPVRLWGTYYGAGSTYDIVYDVTHTKVPAASIVITGVTGSTANISTIGSHQTTLSGSIDAYMAKFDDNGARLWATYYGGTASENSGWNGYGISNAVDANGNIYTAGNTNSTNNIATTGAHQAARSGSDEAFVAKFNASGIRQWGTYLGGTSFDALADIAIGPNGWVYVAGATQSTTNIGTTNTHKAVFSGTGTDAMLVCFDADGVRQWGTYYGGSRSEHAKAVTVGANGMIALVGATNSADGISTANAYQTAYGGGSDGGVFKDDAFVAMFTSQGTLQWATYIGGSGGSNVALGKDRANGVTMDAENNLYVVGVTGTANLATNGALRTSFLANATGFQDGFIARFDAAGARQWFTYFGVTGGTQPQVVRMMGNGKIVLGGNTGVHQGQEPNGLATTDAFKTVSTTTTTGFLAVFTTAGVREYGTYYGGTSPDALWALDANSDGNIYFGGDAQSNTGITTTGSFQPTFGTGTGNTDGYLVKFNLGTPLPLKLLQFAAQHMQGAVHLQWQTASEQNTSHFDIERQYQDQTTWTSIGRQVAAGNSTLRRSYRAADADVHRDGQYRYRLKMADKDGSFSYSPTAMVVVSKRQQWQVWPTATYSRQVMLSLPQAATLTLTDMAGRTLRSYTLPAGIHNLPMPAPAGIYRLRHLQQSTSQPILLQ